MKTAIKLGGAIAMLILLLSGASANLAMPAINDSPAAVSEAQSCQSAVASAYDSISQSNAISNAMNSNNYSQGVMGYHRVIFNSIFQIAKTITPYPDCTQDVQSYNVVFTLENSSGDWAGYLVISENPNLAVSGSTIQNQGGSNNNSYLNWAGYEATPSSPPSNEVYEADSEFVQPTVSYDTTYGCGSADQCMLSTWVGLEDENGAYPDGNLEQDGTSGTCATEGELACASTTYWAWYENGATADDKAVNCSSGHGGAVTVGHGDTIYASVSNDALYSGPDTTYNFDIEDEHNSETCYVQLTNDNFTKPEEAAFIDEDPEFVANGYYEPLASFTGSSFTSAEIYTGGSEKTINNFYTFANNMANGPYSSGTCGATINNVDYGSLSSGGDFTMTYLTNEYTPLYYHNC